MQRSAGLTAALVTAVAGHYGPDCAADETKLLVEDSTMVCAVVEGECDPSSCPTDVPMGASATPGCATSGVESPVQFCGLLCNQSSDCAAGSICAELENGQGVCAYSSLGAHAALAHYGSTCAADETELLVADSTTVCAVVEVNCEAINCPMDVPIGVTASPGCATSGIETPVEFCGLLCSSSSECAAGSICAQLENGQGVCAYSRFTANSALGHYGPTCAADETELEIADSTTTCAVVESNCKSNSCPVDVPAGVSATPGCATSGIESPVEFCGLLCKDTSECATGSICAELENGQRVCAHASWMTV